MKRLSAGLIGFVLIVLIAGGTPARAGEKSWKDPAGDAFPAGLNAPTDITGVSLATTADSFVWKLQVAEIGDSLPVATGHHYTLDFEFGGASFAMRMLQDRVNGNSVAFEKDDPTAPTVEDIGCTKCKLSVDPTTNTLTLTAPLGVMQAASRKLVAGAKIEAVSVYSSLMWATPVGTLYGGSDTGDEAAPEGQDYTL